MYGLLLSLGCWHFRENWDGGAPKWREGARKLDKGAVPETDGDLIETNDRQRLPLFGCFQEGDKTEHADDDLGYTDLHGQ